MTTSTLHPSALRFAARARLRRRNAEADRLRQLLAVPTDSAFAAAYRYGTLQAEVTERLRDLRVEVS